MHPDPGSDDLGVGAGVGLVDVEGVPVLATGSSDKSSPYYTSP